MKPRVPVRRQKRRHVLVYGNDNYGKGSQFKCGNHCAGFCKVISV
jgi:hypothetical protein